MSEYRLEHPDDQTIAAYVDDTLPRAERGGVQAHLAECIDCRTVARDAARVIASSSRRSTARRWIWLPSAAAAAALLWVAPDLGREPDARHREEAVTISAAPMPLAPRGNVASATTFTWSSVPYASTYRLRLFDASGTQLLERETADTSFVLPDTITLIAHEAYFWSIDAQTGYGRWSDSDLIEFIPRKEPSA